MREIKFRAWDPINRVMEYNVNVNQGTPVKKGYQWFNKENTVLHSELMQYTGLKDKNGKEIYEGDIIVYEIYNGVGIESYCARVFWSENEEKYKNRFEWLIDYIETDGFDALSRPAAYNEDLEVIGNIYENPELLEE